MIKIPGTREGWPAIERCLRDGININITLLFSLEHYEAVANAYLNALEARAAAGQPIDRLASVASIFVSRVDTEVDKRAEAKGGSLLDLRGKVAVAGARLDYAKYLDITQSARWRALEAHGAKPQRLLWASTGTKNPKYSDVLYVETLIGPNTISTVPPETLKLFEDHGKVVTALTGDIAGPAGHVLDTLARGGIDYADVNHTLEEEGIDKFAKSYDKLMAVIAEKRKTLARKAPASARG
jgi:transaldolase/glucose-6-phosphate isomerase